VAGDDQPVALISGANRGIGREIARQLAHAGHFVLLGSRSVSAGEREAGQIEAEGGDVSVIELDVRSSEQVERAAAHLDGNPGRLDILVNNAGTYGSPTGAADHDLEQAHDVMETNFWGPWRLTQAVLPLLRRSQRPRIVNVSSGAGQLADMQGGRAAYRVSKAALNALTRTLAADETSSGLLVNTMCPGWVQTDMGGEGAPRSVQVGAETAVWLATLPDDGPSGGFFRDRQPIPW
jgi:NAD(P)-dependent dehydrogenase (short-subunit alcohol dehydrogenase family)